MKIRCEFLPTCGDINLYIQLATERASHEATRAREARTREALSDLWTDGHEHDGRCPARWGEGECNCFAGGIENDVRTALAQYDAEPVQAGEEP
jgi:hypothetical protein